MDPADWVEVLSDRESIVDALVGDPVTLRDLADLTGYSRSTLNRVVRRLEDLGLVGRCEGGYRVTSAGRLALEHYRAYREEVADLQSAEAALSPLSPPAVPSYEAVVGADVFLGEDETLYTPERHLHGLISEAEAYRAVLPALEDPRHLELLHERVVDGGCEAVLLVTEDLFEALIERHSGRLAAMAGQNSFEVFVGETAPFGVLRIDHPDGSCASLVVYGECGLHAMLDNPSPRAVAWADDRIARAVAAAENRTADC